MNTNNYDEALWSCIGCDSWWLSRTLPQPGNWRLFRLPSVDSLELEIGKCPVWLVSGPDPSVCPECGFPMKTHQTQAKSQDHLLIIQN